MIPVIDTKTMRALERRAVDQGATFEQLMQRAAQGVVDGAQAFLKDKKPVIILCGSGNNGGDGLLCAKMLHIQGVPVRVALLHLGALSELCAQALEQAQTVGVCVDEIADERHFATWSLGVQDQALCIDAVLGIGLNRPVTGLALCAIQWLNTQKAPVLAVDVPSGVCADTGRVLGAARVCAKTVTFGCAKVGQLLFPARNFTGQLVVHDIGLEKPQSDVAWIDQEWVQSMLPKRPMDAHKGTFGHVGIVAGSANMPGASVLCTGAALRSGVGLVSLLSEQYPSRLAPEAMFMPLTRPEDVLLFAQGKQALAMGPGLGTSPQVKELMRLTAQELSLPLVLDADALNVLARDIQSLKGLSGRCVVTPHPGEMARLTGHSVQEVTSAPIQAARTLAQESGVVVALKGATTCVATPQGKVAIFTGGCVGLAKGGSGDVLTGLIAGLLAQGLSPYSAAVCGVFLHGRAGVLASKKFGDMAMKSGDIIENLAWPKE